MRRREGFKFGGCSDDLAETVQLICLSLSSLIIYLLVSLC